MELFEDRGLIDLSSNDKLLLMKIIYSKFQDTHDLGRTLKKIKQKIDIKKCRNNDLRINYFEQKGLFAI